MSHPAGTRGHLDLGDVRAEVTYLDNARPRRYLLRLLPDGTFRCTIPRRGTQEMAEQFVRRNAGWMRDQLAKQRARPPVPSIWPPGHTILFRGEKIRLEADPEGRVVRFADEIVPYAGPWDDLRDVVTRRMRALATAELPVLLRAQAARQRLHVVRVQVRDQRSRWGSCSPGKTVALNWRLIMAPAQVAEYVIVHELAHLKEPNHSDRFWREVAAVFPGWEAAERWLKEHGRLLMG
jgi:predicted metal-dependent hydrolase